MRLWHVAGALVLVLAVPLGGAIAARAAQVRLAAPEDCLTNPNCGVGFRATYGLDVSPLFVPLAVADGG